MAPVKEFKSSGKEGINCMDWSNKTQGLMAITSGNNVSMVSTE